MNETVETASAPVVPQYQPVVIQQPRKRRFGAFWIILLSIVALCSFCGLVTILTTALTEGTTKSEKGQNGTVYTYVMGNEKSDNKILAIYIDQPILTAAQDYDNSVLTSLLVGQYVFGYQIKDQLTKAVDDSSIKAVILMINSPGGTVAGARAIADGVTYYREKTQKPVYAYVQDMAASGAYWAAASADKIYAEQGSLSGSIGVLMGPFEYYDKLVSLGTVGTQNGISITYITGGKFKDFGNPTKKLSEEELSILQKGINTEYDKFVAYVASRRGIEKSTIKDDIKALVYGADEAKNYRLIDEIGSREQTLTALAAHASIADYQVVKVGTSVSFFGTLFSKFTAPVNEKAASTVPARSCVLCSKMLYFYGDPNNY